MSDLDVAEITIVNAAETWAIRRQALFDLPEGAEGASRYNDLTIAAAQLHDAVMAKLSGTDRAREFGPTPAEEYLIDERVESLEMDRDYLQVQLRHVVSFLGPAFKQWEEKCQRI